MKKIFCHYLQLTVIGLAAAAGARTEAQTNTTAAAGTNSVGTNVTEMGTTTVVGHLNQERNQILTEVGASAYSITTNQIATQAQGENAPFNQVILRSPGVAEDSAVNGDLHVRGEHANLQYRIDGVLLPEGIAEFGLELDPRFVENMQLITGSLPAEYGFRTAGIVDIQTRNGAIAPGGEVGVYGGSYNTIRPFVQYGGTYGKWNFFGDGSYEHNSLGIENPVGTSTALHDQTEQFKTFLYGSYLIDASSRLTLIASASYSDYEVPDQPGLPAGTAPNGTTFASEMTTLGLLPSGTFNSAVDNERQNEENYYTALTYQKSAGDLNYQISLLGRESEQHFRPDPIGDLYLDGEASEIHRTLYSGGLQADGSYELGEKNTVRAGGLFLAESTQNNSSTEVFTEDGSGAPTGLEDITDDHPLYGLFIGTYLQDEWKILPNLTLNTGARFDVYESSFDDENQLSPRANLVYKPWENTTLHAGYSRYFTPPPIEDVGGSTLNKYVGTSGAPLSFQDSPIKAERANYYDAGITQTILPGWNIGLDAYYKTAQQQLDDGLFGQTLILSAFNYERGRVRGVELTSSYTSGGFSAYFNGAYSVAQGENWDTAQFLFSPADIAYVQNHWISLDHDQTFTGTGGVSYRFNEGPKNTTLFYLDLTSGSGLRQDGGGLEGGPGSGPIPNGASVPDYYELNVGTQHTFQLAGHQAIKARLDVVNLTDNVYELRGSSGVGVNLAQYGMRRGLFATLSYSF